MPPRRGGRGRGAGRARPPQAIRNSMADIGMGSIAGFDLMVQAAANANADASRAYFPILDQGQKTTPVKLQPSEDKLVTLSEDIQRSIRNSPHAVTINRQTKQSDWCAQLNAVSTYFTSSQVVQSNESKKGDIWDLKDNWVIPELFPGELLPQNLRTTKTEKRPSKQVKVSNNLLSDMDVRHAIKGEATAAAVEDDDSDKDDKEKEQNEANARDKEAAPDSDLELDADYQTVGHFDDDEGYEEVDSGAEEATF